MTERTRETGSALVVSILVLFVLTVFGLAVMLTASIEGEIAVNYRWSEMANYHAEAGLEFAKNVLAAYATRPGAKQFRDALPPARGAGQMNAPPAGPVQGRDYQYSIEQSSNVTMYIGKVLTDPTSGQRYEFDAQGSAPRGGQVDGDGSVDIQGTVTIWVRRPIVGDLDYDRDDRAIITAEGTAPNYEGALGRAAALRRLDMLVRVPSGPSKPSLAHALALGGSDMQSPPTTTTNNIDVNNQP